MKQTTSDIFAIIAIVLVLAGVNDHNPSQNLCLLVAVVCGVISTAIHKGIP